MRSKILILIAILSHSPMTTSATERAFAPTDVDTIEVKTIPAARLIKASGDKRYFDANNGLFRPLFRFISSNDIKMTTPVEAAIDPGEMYFYLGSDTDTREFESNEEVSVINLPERTVVAIGIRGGYSEENFEKGRVQLQTWLDKNPEWSATDEARGIYWNGPFTPFFMKRSEVHIPVKSVP